MAQLCSSPRSTQLVALQQGDYVEYVGANAKIQQDYGNQPLQILRIDGISGLTVCENSTGSRLVGTHSRDFQRI